MRRDVRFWGWLAVASLFVNIPLAVAMVVHGLHPAIAFGAAALSGITILVVHDAVRAPRRTEEFRATIRQREAEASYSPSSR